LLENCIFYISQLYEFSHRLGLGCAKTRGSRIGTEGFQPGGAVGLLSKINEFES
jgi:hypothetical protein